MWSLFRVENEHCNNVGKFRASRDVPLPYKIKKQYAQTQTAQLPEVREEEPSDEEEEARVEEECFHL